MTLHQLKLFVLMARHLNIREVSEELHISQPSVSEEINLLERELGVKLHMKIGRGIELTNKGKLFYREARKIARSVDNLRRLVKEEPNEGGLIPLNIGGSQVPSMSFLPSALTAFRRKHPRVQITLRTDTSHAIEQLILNSELDIGFIVNPSHSPSLCYIRGQKGESVAFSSVKHPLAKKKKIALEDLSQVQFVGRTPAGSRDRLERPSWRVQNYLGRPNIVIYCDSHEAVKAVVKNGAGVGILNRVFVDADVRRGELKIIKIPGLKLEVNTFITYHKDRALSPIAQDFLTFILQRTRKALTAKRHRLGM